jgi:hypothetical protein
VVYLRHFSGKSIYSIFAKKMQHGSKTSLPEILTVVASVIIIIIIIIIIIGGAVLSP